MHLGEFPICERSQCLLSMYTCNTATMVWLCAAYNIQEMMPLNSYLFIYLVTTMVTKCKCLYWHICNN